jgi:hypothetical protein
VILGDSIHNFCDGIIIAAAFLADTRLGIVTSLAIIAHEIPQEVGDYIVLLNAASRARGRCSSTRSRAWPRSPAASSATSSSGRGSRTSRTCSSIAASSFIYVAVADLIPQLQHRLTLRETARAAVLARRGAGDRRRRDQPAALGRVTLPQRRQPGREALSERRAPAPSCASSTSCVSLPRKSDARPLRPCEPMTIRSQPFFSA